MVTFDDPAAARGLRLHDLLDAWASEQPQAESAANQFANAIVAAGCGPGSRIAMLARNCIEYALVYFAASRAGVVVVPLNFRAAPSEWAYVLNDAEATLLLAAAEVTQQVDRMRSELVHLRTCITLGEAEGDWLAFGAWVGAQPASPPERDPAPADDLAQLYT